MTAKKKAVPKAKAPVAEGPPPEATLVEPETDDPVQIVPTGSGTLKFRTNGWVSLDRVQSAQFEKDLRRARQS